MAMMVVGVFVDSGDFRRAAWCRKVGRYSTVVVVAAAKQYIPVVVAKKKSQFYIFFNIFSMNCGFLVLVFFV
jgi:hypothetical protein